VSVGGFELGFDRRERVSREREKRVGKINSREGKGETKISKRKVMHEQREAESEGGV